MQNDTDSFIMVITGIRHKIRIDIDTRRTASFTRYLMHYLRMFAILGIIIPVLAGVDYILEPYTRNETVSNKFYQVMNDHDNTEYHIYTDTYHFIASTAFYEHTDIGDQVTYYYTPIFKTLTDISHQAGQNVYVCKPFSIYNWPIVAPVLTLVCSTIMLIKTRRKKPLRYEPVINLGVINAFLCVFTLVFVLFHIHNGI